MLITAQTAGARPDDYGTGDGKPLSLCEQQAVSTNTSVLPAIRWDDASSHLHTRLGGAIWDDVPQKLQRNGYTENLLSVGNMFWSLTSSATEFSGKFCPLEVVGGTIDDAAATLGKAVLSSPLPVAGVSLALIGFLWRKRQRGGSPRQLIGTMVIVALLAVMVAGASASTGGGRDGSSAAYVPGKLSPGWLVVKTNTAISTLAAAPVQALNTVQVSTKVSSDPLSCLAYTNAMHAQYQERWGSSLASSAAAGVPQTISSMWEQSGLQAWKRAQFGTNPYGDRVYCRLLESYAATPTDQVTELMVMAGVSRDLVVPDALAWRAANDPVERDRQMIGWAACQAKNPSGKAATFTFTSPLFVKEADREDADRLCRNFFTEASWTVTRLTPRSTSTRWSSRPGTTRKLCSSSTCCTGKTPPPARRWPSPTWPPACPCWWCSASSPVR